jgi:ABC-type transport system substrate-binding protein
VVKSYESKEQLLKAAEQGEIDGSADFGELNERSFVAHSLELPRYHVLFFNMQRPALKKIEDRQRVMNAQDGAAVSYTLVTSQSGASSDFADTLARELAQKHITLTILKKTSATLQKEDIAKREFDMLLYGINYGIERDYYPFWHSSQVGANGLNISGVKDKELDTLLETARREADLTKREAINKQIETFLTEKALQKVISQEKFNFWVRKSIKGAKYGTIIEDGNDRFALVWQWYVKSKKVKNPVEI